MDINKKDKKILYELDRDSRQSLSKLSKKVGLSKQVLSYRMRNLVESGIIKKFITIINTAKFGYMSYRVYIRYQNITPEKEKEFINYLVGNPNVHWFASLSGRWDLELLIFAKDFYHYNLIFDEIKTKYGKYVKDASVSIAVYSYHLKHRYFLDSGEKELFKLPYHYGGPPETVKIDEIDRKILDVLAHNSRATTVSIAEKVGSAANTVKTRIKRMEKEKIIQTYRLWIDASKLGYTLYKALITTENINETKIKSMLTFCDSIPNIIYCIRCSGNWEIEIEAECRTDQEFRDILLRFRNQFGDIIRDYETLLVYNEHKITYFPV